MIDWNIVVSLLSFIVSAASVFVAYLAICESKKTTLGTTISGSRQRWINTLRNELVEIITIIHYVPYAYARKIMSKEEVMLVEYRKLLDRYHTIVLLVNPNEDSHSELIRLIKEASGGLIDLVKILGQEPSQEPCGDSEYHQDSVKEKREELKYIRDKILELSQSIFKEEWKRVKRGE